jgi:cytochrome b561
MPKSPRRPAPKTSQPHLQASPYSAAAITLHWTMALLLVGLLLLGYGLAHDYWAQPFAGQLVGWHKSFGVVALILAVTRLTYRMTHTYPGYVKMPGWMRAAAQFNHYALYVMMFWMPLTGYTMSELGGHGVSFFGLFDLPNLLPLNKDLGREVFTLHVIGMWVILALVGLHVSAALYHQLLRKDGTLGRMLPFLQDIGKPAR